MWFIRLFQNRIEVRKFGLEVIKGRLLAEGDDFLSELLLGLRKAGKIPDGESQGLSGSFMAGDTTFFEK
jgi:hypothetical protein